MQIFRRVAAFVLAAATAGGFAWAQGVQTANLIGTVTGPDGAPLPGVSVTVTSPNLIGERTTTTAVNGDYLIKNLPPGPYTVKFSLEGMKPLESSAVLPLGGTTRVDARLEIAEAAETIQVVGEAPSALETTTVGANFKAEEVVKLPMGRSLSEIASYAPGLTTNTPNAGQVTISGGFAYDNVFLVNGVDVNDNLFGTPNNLFIEDAIAETQVLTSGISAEYGRFSGGVINSITKSGGNQFSGSFRADFSKPEWRDETPFEKQRNQKRKGHLSKYYQATLGGFVLRDRLWFFLAGRDESSSSASTFPVTGIPFTTTVDNERLEVKLTGNITMNHSLQASFTENETAQGNRPAFSFSIDPRVAVNRTLPNELRVVSYNGVLTNSLFGEARWSEKVFGFRNSGGTSRDIKDSPFRALGATPGIPAGSHYNAPYFDSTDPEDRNNEQIAAALSYFLSSQALGSHDIKLGWEQFTTTRVGGNSQSSTGFVFWVDPVAVNGVVQRDSQGRIIPNFVPGVSRLYEWIPTRGAKIDIETNSFYLNDRWDLNANWSFNLGVRYERVRSRATGGINTVNTDTIVPRLGVSFDPLGNGKFKIDATYAKYAGKYQEAQFGRNSPVGNPTLVQRLYQGPAGQGLDFAPGFDLANWSRIIGINVPTGNVFFEDGMSSPTTNEFTFALGSQLPRGGYAKLIFTDRKVEDFIEDFILFSEGKVTVEVAGARRTLDKRIYRNSNLPTREYQALQLQGRYRPIEGLTIDLGWTYQLKNNGDFEGEGTNTPAISSAIGDYPEILVRRRSEPWGRLNDFQEHKVRLSATYGLSLGRAGTFDLGLIWRYDSPLTFSYVATAVPLSPQQIARDPGYALPPTSQTVYFGDRGIGEFNATSLFDVAVTYRIPVWKSLEPWVKFQVFNVLNDDTLATFDTSITANTAGPKDADGLPLEFTRGPNFGKATSSGNYVTPREYFIAAGIRF
jgi:hypothetical protein